MAKGTHSGIKTVEHPLTKKSIPVFEADYVVPNYGTSAVMGVPAHDLRDAAFATANHIAFVKVLSEEGGRLIKSPPYTGMTSEEARKTILADLVKENLGSPHVTYKLRDWLVSRQRPWGAPIPIVHCDSCGAVPVKEADLPVPLAPRGDVAALEKWKSCSCPACGKLGQRETDTMDTFVDSSWYFLRYTDPHNSLELASKERRNAWMAVDTYIGGVEHAVLHLLYARFVHKFLASELQLKSPEPFANLLTQGMVQAKTFRLDNGNRPVPASEVDEAGCLVRATGEKVRVTWEKMSKSKFNGVDPPGHGERVWRRRDAFVCAFSRSAAHGDGVGRHWHSGHEAVAGPSVATGEDSDSFRS